jgi:hypothetical protein
MLQVEEGERSVLELCANDEAIACVPIVCWKGRPTACGSPARTAATRGGLGVRQLQHGLLDVLRQLDRKKPARGVKVVLVFVDDANQPILGRL